jgi:hypothetical protein
MAGRRWLAAVPDPDSSRQQEPGTGHDGPLAGRALEQADEIRAYPVLSRDERDQVLGDLEGQERASVIGVLLAKGLIREGPYGPVITEEDMQLTLGLLAEEGTWARGAARDLEAGS